MLSAAIILAIMVMPYIMSVSREVLLAVPNTQREAAMALGATRWEALTGAVLPYARSGIIGAVILGLGRALGETMAVTMVIGNRHEIAASLFAPGYTMAAAIANEFAEAVENMPSVGAVVRGADALRGDGPDQRGGPAAHLARRPGRRGEVGMNRAAARRRRSHVMVGLMGLAVVLAVLPLLLILGTLAVKGAGSLNLAFFTKLPVPAGETGGGVMHAIVGTLMIVGTACLIGLPLGIGAGIYCAEYPGSRLATLTRFVSDVLNGTPSIVVGVFAWTWIVASQKHFSALAGSVALAILMIPMVTRTTEEMIKLVPHSLREAALALGYSRWRTSLTVVVRTTLPGIVTGSLLAVARVAGETAPLLFTALGKPVSLLQPRPADGGPAAGGVHLRHRSVRGVAPAGVGHGAGADPGRPGAQHRCAAGDAAEVHPSWLSPWPILPPSD